MSSSFLPHEGSRTALAIATVVLLSACCFAALGGGESSIVADQTHMKAQRRVVQNSGYSVHEMQDANGIMVREFVSPGGKVFGVSWQGPVRPDLQQVLGSYYDQFMRSAPTRRTHGPVNISVPGLVVQTGGHARALMGHAYIPEMVPNGMNPGDIR